MVEIMEVEAGQDWVVDRMTEADAPKVVALFLSIYGQDYPVKTFIDPDLLIAENQSGRTISSVARTPKGDIVGHNAIFHSAPSEVIYESGAGLVHPAYRGGRGIFTEMVKHGEVIIKEQTQAAAVFGEPVSNHVFSQRMCRGLGWMTMAMEVDLMPASAYAKEKSAAGRVTTLLDFKTIRPRPHRLYLPEVYESNIGKLYEALDDQRETAAATTGFSARRKTRIEARFFAFAQVVRMAVHDLGEDFPEKIEAEETSARAKGAQVFQAWLNLTDPAVGRAVDILRSRGYFFGGPLPRWFDGDGLLMQKLDGPPFWDEINLYYDRAEMLLEMVRHDWLQTT